MSEVYGHPLLADDGIVGPVVRGTKVSVLSVMQHVNIGLDPRLSYPDLTDAQIEACKAYAEESRLLAQEFRNHEQTDHL